MATDKGIWQKRRELLQGHLDRLWADIDASPAALGHEATLNALFRIYSLLQQADLEMNREGGRNGRTEYSEPERGSDRPDA